MGAKGLPKSTHMQTDADPDPLTQSDTQSSFQRAIRARALDTINLQINQPTPTLRRRLMTGAMVLVIVMLLVLTIDFGVRVMHHIMQIWGYEEVPVPPPVFNPDQPFYITVEPPVEADQSPTIAPDKADAVSK